MLDVDGLNIIYETVHPEIHAIQDVSFTLEHGDTLGIIGESGSGKSSLALALMGLLPQARIQGRIRYRNKNLTRFTHKMWQPLRWREIAIVFQNSLEALNPVLTINRQIGEALKRHNRLNTRKVEKTVAGLMTLVGLSPEWLHCYPHQLSGGMRQRVLIAMAVSCSPQLLIVDEPTSALDPESSDEILQLILALQKRLGFAMIIISHNLPAITRMTNQVITLYGGQVVEKGPTRAVLNDPLHCYTRGLINASPDFHLYKDLWGISGESPGGKALSSGCVFYPRCCQHEAACKQTRPLLRETRPGRHVACHKGGIETFLTGKNIRKTYQLNGKSIPAVDGVDIDIQSGEIAALVGRSGSGKSTLAQVLVNVLEKDDGYVTFQKKELTGREATSRMNGLQMVFQDPFSSISDRMSVIDVVCEPLNIMKWETKDKRREQAVLAMGLVRLPASPDFLNRRAYTLSGGQRQRVALARALVTRPRLLIADEITAMLDPSTQANIIRELRCVQNRQGFSMLYITHDLFLARKIADRIFVMSHGKIVESGPASRVLETPDHPVTQSLVRTLKISPSTSADDYLNLTLAGETP